MIEEKRMKRAKGPGAPSFIPPPEPPISTTTNIDELFEEEAARMREDKVERSKGKFKPLDRVRIKILVLPQNDIPPPMSRRRRLS